MNFTDACAIVASLNARIFHTREIADTRDAEGYGYVATFDPGAPTTRTIPGDAIPSVTIRDAYHPVELVGWADIEALHAGLGRVLAGRG